MGHKENHENLHNNSSPPPKKAKSKKSRAQRQKIKKESPFSVQHLRGHHANIFSVDVKGKWLLTGSQDTSIKLWNLTTKEELHHLHGHSDTISCLKIIHEAESRKLYDLLVNEGNENLTNNQSQPIDFLFISASNDCSIKIWSIPSGTCLKSIYTFSPVSTFLLCENIVFAGSDNGKLTAFNLINGVQVCDVLIHNDKITALKSNGQFLLSSSLDGTLKLWKILSSENELKLTLNNSLVEDDGQLPVKKPILTAFFYQDNIVFGDSEGNVNIVNCLFEQICSSCLPRKQSTCVDSFCLLDHQLILATFNAKAQETRLHVYDLDNDLSYLTSFGHSELTRIHCCCADRSTSGVFLVTGGSKLLEWKKAALSSSNKKEIGDVSDSFTVVGKPAQTLIDASSNSESLDTTDDDSCDEASTYDASIFVSESDAKWWCALF